MTSARLRPAVLCGGLLVLLDLGGCKSLPDTVPYKAVIMVDGTDKEPLQLLLGGDLLLDGQKVGTIEKLEQADFMVNVAWTGPKDGFRAVLGGTYAIRLPGVCGELELSAEGPNEVWRNKSENDLAHDVETDGAIPIYVKPQLPTRHDLLVDWGSGTHEVKVGQQTLKAGEKQMLVFLEGCDAPAPVEVDGKVVGTLDSKSPVHLISADAERCHQVREIPFGNQGGPLADTIVTTTQVTPLESIPYYVFEEAPYSITVPEGVDRTSVTELTARACPASPAAG